MFNTYNNNQSSTYIESMTTKINCLLSDPITKTTISENLKDLSITYIGDISGNKGRSKGWKAYKQLCGLMNEPITLKYHDKSTSKTITMILTVILTSLNMQTPSPKQDNSMIITNESTEQVNGKYIYTDTSGTKRGFNTIKEIAEYLNMGRTTLTKKMKSGELNIVKTDYKKPRKPHINPTKTGKRKRKVPKNKYIYQEPMHEWKELDPEKTKPRERDTKHFNEYVHKALKRYTGERKEENTDEREKLSTKLDRLMTTYNPDLEPDPIMKVTKTKPTIIEVQNNQEVPIETILSTEVLHESSEEEEDSESEEENDPLDQGGYVSSEEEEDESIEGEITEEQFMKMERKAERKELSKLEYYEKYSYDPWESCDESDEIPDRTPSSSDFISSEEEEDSEEPDEEELQYIKRQSSTNVDRIINKYTGERKEVPVPEEQEDLCTKLDRLMTTFDPDLELDPIVKVPKERPIIDTPDEDLDMFMGTWDPNDTSKYQEKTGGGSNTDSEIQNNTDKYEWTMNMVIDDAFYPLDLHRYYMNTASQGPSCSKLTMEEIIWDYIDYRSDWDTRKYLSELEEIDLGSTHESRIEGLSKYRLRINYKYIDPVDNEVKMIKIRPKKLALDDIIHVGYESGQLFDTSGLIDITPYALENMKEVIYEHKWHRIKGKDPKEPWKYLRARRKRDHKGACIMEVLKYLKENPEFVYDLEIDYTDDPEYIMSTKPWENEEINEHSKTQSTDSTGVKCVYREDVIRKYRQKEAPDKPLDEEVLEREYSTKENQVLSTEETPEVPKIDDQSTDEEEDIPDIPDEVLEEPTEQQEAASTEEEEEPSTNEDTAIEILNHTRPFRNAPLTATEAEIVRRMDGETGPPAHRRIERRTLHIPGLEVPSEVRIIEKEVDTAKGKVSRVYVFGTKAGRSWEDTFTNIPLQLDGIPNQIGDLLEDREIDMNIFEPKQKNRFTPLVPKKPHQVPKQRTKPRRFSRQKDETIEQILFDQNSDCDTDTEETTEYGGPDLYPEVEKITEKEWDELELKDKYEPEPVPTVFNEFVTETLEEDEWGVYYTNQHKNGSEGYNEGDEYGGRGLWWAPEHDKVRYSLELLKRLRGDNIGKGSAFSSEFNMTPHVFIKILEDIPNPFSWVDVFNTYRDHGFDDPYWLGFGHKSGLFPQEPERWTEADGRVVFEIVGVINKTSKEYKWLERYKVGTMNLWYIIKKVIDLRGGDSEWVPLKTEGRTLRVYEDKWQDVCEKHGLKYQKLVPYTHTIITKNGFERAITNPSKIPKVSWEKEATIEKFKRGTVICNRQMHTWEEEHVQIRRYDDHNLYKHHGAKWYQEMAQPKENRQVFEYNMRRLKLNGYVEHDVPVSSNVSSAPPGWKDPDLLPPDQARRKRDPIDPETGTYYEPPDIERVGVTKNPLRRFKPLRPAKVPTRYIEQTYNTLANPNEVHRDERVTYEPNLEDLTEPWREVRIHKPYNE